MKILFAGNDKAPLGGARDIIATDVRTKDIDELVEANNSLGYDWWHIYDTTKREITLEGRFKAAIVNVKRNSEGFPLETSHEATKRLLKK